MEEKVEQISDTTEDKVITYEEYKVLEQGFYEERQKMEERLWLDSNSSKFDEVLRQNYEQSVRKFSENIINYIAKVSKAVYGAFFIVDHEKNLVKATAGYACTVDTMERSTFNIGEGLIGQVARSQEMLCIDNVETELNSSLGRVNATFLLITPLVFNEKVYGVIEINILGRPEQRYLTLIERLSHSIASTLQSIINNQRTKQLLIESLQQAEDFKIQEEELEQLKTQLSETQAKLEDAETRLSQIVMPSETAQANSPENTEDLAILSQTLEQKTKELENAQSQLEAVQAELDSAKKIAEAIETEDAALVNAQQALEQKIAELEKQLEAQKSHFETALAASEAKNQDLQAKLETKQKELAEALNQIVWQSEEANENPQATIEELKQKLERKQKELAEALNQIVWQSEEANENPQATIEELKQKLERKQKELAEALNQIVWQESNEEEAKSDNPLATAEVDHLQKELTRKNEEITTLRTALKESETQSEELTQLRQEYEALQASTQSQTELQEAQATLEALEQEIAQNQRDMNNLRETIKWKDQEIERQDEAFAEQKRKIKALSEVLNEKEEENFKHLEEIVRQGKQISAQAQELHQLKQEVEGQRDQHEIRQELELIQMKLKRKEDELMVTQYLLKQQEKGELSEVVQDLQQQLQTKNQEIEQLSAKHGAGNESPEEIQQLLQDLQTKEQLLTQQEEALKQMREQLLEKEKQNEQLQKALEELPANNPTVAEQAHIQTDNLPENTVELAEKLNELENIQTALRQKEEEIGEQAKVIEAQAKNLTEQQAAIQKAREENETLAKQIEAQKHEIEQRQTQMQQKESELSSLFNKINNAFASLEVDMEGNILSINNKFLMMLGYRIEDLQGEKYDKLLQPEFVHSSEYRILWEALKMGVAQNQENFICISNKGKEINMHVSFIPIIGAEGKPYEVVMLVSHILPEHHSNGVATKGKNLSDHLDYSQIEHEIGEKFKAIDSSFVLIELDLKGNITNANKQFLSFLGYELEEVQDKHHSHFLDVTDRSSVSYQSIINNLGNGSFASKLLKYVGKEGERIRLRSYFNSLKDAEGNPSKVLVISQFVN